MSAGVPSNPPSWSTTAIKPCTDRGGCWLVRPATSACGDRLLSSSKVEGYVTVTLTSPFDDSVNAAFFFPDSPRVPSAAPPPAFPSSDPTSETQLIEPLLTPVLPTPWQYTFVPAMR